MKPEITPETQQVLDWLLTRFRSFLSQTFESDDRNLIIIPHGASCDLAIARETRNKGKTDISGHIMCCLPDTYKTDNDYADLDDISHDALTIILEFLDDKSSQLWLRKHLISWTEADRTISAEIILRKDTSMSCFTEGIRLSISRDEEEYYDEED